MSKTHKELAMKKSFTICASLFAALLFTGCGAARTSHFYQLGVVNDLSRPAASGEQIPVRILVVPFMSSHLYREDRIVYGSSTEEMGLYQYERWTEPPSEMLHDIIVRRLRGSGRYKEVFSMRSSARGEYILRGHLYDLKEISTANGLVARVTFEAELVDAKTRDTLWTHPYQHDEPVSGKTVAALVSALDRNVQAGVSDLATGLEQYFAAHPPAPPAN